MTAKYIIIENGIITNIFNPKGISWDFNKTDQQDAENVILKTNPSEDFSDEQKKYGFDISGTSYTFLFSRDDNKSVNLIAQFIKDHLQEILSLGVNIGFFRV